MNTIKQFFVMFFALFESTTKTIEKSSPLVGEMLFHATSMGCNEMRKAHSDQLKTHINEAKKEDAKTGITAEEQVKVDAAIKY